MNKHDKTRYVFAQAIKGLIKVHPLDKIAVTDIVTRSGMTRQTAILQQIYRILLIDRRTNVDGHQRKDVAHLQLRLPAGRCEDSVLFVHPAQTQIRPALHRRIARIIKRRGVQRDIRGKGFAAAIQHLSLIHISEPTRP